MDRQQDYPLDQVEWNILTDTQEESEYLKETGQTKHKAGIRNQDIFSRRETAHRCKAESIHQFGDGEVFVNIDDDDYYMPNRISHAIDRLFSSDADMQAVDTCQYILLAINRCGYPILEKMWHVRAPFLQKISPERHGILQHQQMEKN